MSTCRRCSFEQGFVIYSHSLKCVITEMSVKNTPDEQCHIYRIVTKVLVIAFMLNKIMKTALDEAGFVLVGMQTAGVTKD